MWQEPKNVKGPFTANLVIDAPFNIQTEPYIIAGTTAVADQSSNNLPAIFVILSIIIVVAIVSAFHKKNRIES